jgi:hypothetical protein
VARLIRTEKEVEGRFEEVWIVVEEDPLEQWPAGPREIVGRPATRKSGPERVRGAGRPTTASGPSGHCSSGSSSTTIHTSSKRPSTSFSVRISLAN